VCVCVVGNGERFLFRKEVCVGGTGGRFGCRVIVCVVGTRGNLPCRIGCAWFVPGGSFYLG